MGLPRKSGARFYGYNYGINMMKPELKFSTQKDLTILNTILK